MRQAGAQAATGKNATNETERSLKDVNETLQQDDGAHVWLCSLTNALHR